MDERKSLEIEVDHHLAVIAQLREALRGFEQGGTGAPPRSERQVCALRLALAGRTMAVEVGAARLKVLTRAEALGQA